MYQISYEVNLILDRLHLRVDDSKEHSSWKRMLLNVVRAKKENSNNLKIKIKSI